MEKLFQTGIRYISPRGVNRFVAFIFLGLLLLGATATVYLAGGTHFAYVHIFYIPVIVAGFMFSFRGGIITGLLSGLLLGPWIPMDTVNQISQPLDSWLTRGVIFMVVGGAAGFSSFIFQAYMKDLERKLTTNVVTGLPNLAGLEKIFRHHLKVGPAQKGALIVLDLHNLKDIEIAVGGPGTEALFRALAVRLKKIVDTLGVISHPHASGFVVFLPDAKNLEEILMRCDQHMGTSFTINDIPLFAEIFYSTVLFPDHGENLGELLRNAKIGLDHSTTNLKRFSLYQKGLSSQKSEEIKLLHALNIAIREEALTLHYQPQVNLRTGDVIGVEALARWTHPLHGPISPAAFIPLAERTLLINPFTQWIMRQALEDLATWHKKGILISLSINYSMKNFLDDTTLSKLFELLEKYKIPPSYITIEITETAVADNIDQVAQKLKHIRRKGIKIAIDDFGTGQASQEYLMSFPLSSLKIDRIFVKDLCTHPAAEAIVDGAVRLSKNLKLDCMAEGIETQEEVAKLLAMGCEKGQGYLIEKPMDMPTITTWLAGKNYAPNTLE